MTGPEIAEFRYVIQLATFFAALFAIVFLIHAVLKKFVAWRYVVMPVAILVQIAVFYGYVQLSKPDPSPELTFWSAIIRFEEVAAVVVAMIGLYRYRKNK